MTKIKQAVNPKSLKAKFAKQLDLDKAEESTIEDRVFVCVGKYTESKKIAVWVMTINKDCNEV
jgi:hypothetical protein